tara:strand:- start:1045 stop:1368 length:324 start_codon:yes stop_codon:yes gene_type:complete
MVKSKEDPKGFNQTNRVLVSEDKKVILRNKMNKDKTKQEVYVSGPDKAGPKGFSRKSKITKKTKPGLSYSDSVSIEKTMSEYDKETLKNDKPSLKIVNAYGKKVRKD